MADNTDLPEIIQTTSEYVTACVDENAEINGGDWDWSVADMWRVYIGDCLDNENYKDHEVMGPLQGLTEDELRSVKDAVIDHLGDVQVERAS